MNRMKISIGSGVLAAVCMIALLPLQAQTTTNTPARDPLMPLKRALETAGAPALTATQETQLNTLIGEIRTANAPQRPTAAVQAARAAYESAIVGGDLTGAGTQIQFLVNDREKRETAAMTALARFSVTALGVLATNSDQTKLLLRQFGNQGVVRVLEVLAGRPGMGVGTGVRMGGPGMGITGPRMQGYGRKQ
jgi:hypothetical protein